MLPIRLLALVLLASAPAAQTVWTVSSQPSAGADFPDLQPAIDAAGDGDVILVRPGSYSAFEIDGKSLTITNDAASSIIPNSVALPGLPGEPEAFVRVRNLAADQSVVLRGLQLFSGQVFTPTVGLHLLDNDGAVVVEDSFFGMFNPFTFEIDVVHGIWTQRSESVLLVDVTATAHRASEGLLVDDSNVFAYGCELSGGQGGLDQLVPFTGGDGARLTSGSLFLSGCDLDGGNGFTTQPFTCNDPIDAGNGATVDGGVFRDLDTTFSGGIGGSGAFCGFPDAADGVEVETNGGTREMLDGVARSLTAPSPVYVGTTLEETFQAPPGELAYQRLGVTLAPATYVPALTGPLLFSGPQFTRFQGVIGAGGTLVKSIPLSDFGLTGLTIHLQSLFLDVVALEAYLGSATTVVLLDDVLAP